MMDPSSSLTGMPPLASALRTSRVVSLNLRINVKSTSQRVIDATKLDQNSPAIGWISGRQKFENEEDYMPWWAREIIPKYNNSGIATLAVATGNPNASGELSEQPPGVRFRMGYFKQLGEAKKWSA